jgi:hypothetical protein
MGLLIDGGQAGEGCEGRWNLARGEPAVVAWTIPLRKKRDLASFGIWGQYAQDTAVNATFALTAVITLLNVTP